MSLPFLYRIVLKEGVGVFEVDCLDPYDKPIEYYTQWDVDQTMKIILNGCKEGYLAIPPEIHFANAKSKEAIVVNSTVEGNDTIIVDVPDAILEEEYPLLIYVYLADKNDASSKKTVATKEIPIVKRVRPGDH